MTVRRCISWPDRRLSTAVSAISNITDEIRELWQDMIDTMEAMPGVGLAAPQIGEMLQLVVVDASEIRGRAIRMANPVVLSSSSELSEYVEASPNLLGVSAKVRRPKTVTVRFLNDSGIVDRRDFSGLWSTSVQHQIDHLNGKMYFDNISKVRRDILLRKARKNR